MNSDSSGSPDLMGEDEDFCLDENLLDELKLEEDVEMIYKATTQEPNDNHDNSYEVISVEKIAEKMNDLISEVSSVINVPKTTTRVLLNHFKWDKEKLMEEYYDGDQEKLFSEAHVVNPFDAKKSQDTKSITNECQVCFTPVEDSFTLAGLPCGHLFCTECWDQYLKTKIISDGEADSIQCVAYKCAILVDDETVTSLLKNLSDKSKYQRLIMNSFVEANKFFRWCPYPGCNNVIKVKSTRCQLIKCKCNHIFCFFCGDNYHEPISCEMLRKWTAKCNDDSETMNWLSVNTKDCPKCKTVIEKNGGCNIMTCRKCKHAFCWICMKEYYVEHAGDDVYRCGNFVPTENKKSTRATLEKYLFYCNRYLAHQQSLKLEGQLYEMIEQKMHELINEHNLSWVDVRYLKDSVDILRASRQTLSYTYVFAYYVIKNNQVDMFEINQNDLHRAVESLSEYLERDIVNEDYVEVKIKVSDLCRYCEDRRKILLKHIQEGNETDWWIFEK